MTSDTSRSRHLRRELDTGQDAYLVLNRLNLRVERDASRVVIEDELDPDHEEAVGLDEFEAMLRRQA